MADRGDPGTGPAGNGRPVTVTLDPQLLLARQRLDAVNARQTSTVGYVSHGHCLIVGPPERALEAAARLGLPGVTVAHVDPAADRATKALTDAGVAVFTVPALELDGHLGAFTARARAASRPPPASPTARAADPAADATAAPLAPGSAPVTDLAVSARRPEGRFDLVLDLSADALIARRLPPFGYAHAPDEAALERAVAELAELVGEFDKPRYFAYDASICAHSRSRLPGCSRCLDVCVAGAIGSAGDGVAVDPHLCQGCGSCATLCPSGAMVYAYPKPSDAIARTRERLAARSRDAGCAVTTLVLHGEGVAGAVEAAALPGDALALAVEEVSAFGIDYWASVLCAGVGRILVVSAAAADDPNRRALEEQSALLARLVDGLGLGPEIVQLVPPAALDDLAALPAAAPRLVALAETGPPPAAFATHDDKRATLRLALDTLAAALARDGTTPKGSGPGDAGRAAGEDVVSLPAGSPFGRIRVDTDACTLCMACVSTCPAGALLDGQDSPALRQIEANCVQCGLCERACPERAIALEPRYRRDSVAARRIETLHEEAPFHCVVCHKPFATRAVIDTMLGKLAGHWMFRDDKALRRLKMCEDCRVRDIFGADAAGIDVHGGTDGDSTSADR